ncbi:hypothetical protein V2W45_188952 [Cenococcum geophilum]
MSRPQPVYSAAQWEQHKETVRRLYRDEEKTLDDVAATMARDFDFHATRKQYLDRINKWCYGKNIRSNVMMCVAIIGERRRRRHGKETLFRYPLQRWCPTAGGPCVNTRIKKFRR